MTEFTDQFQRTTSGRAALARNDTAMDRPTRNLLRVIDLSCSGEEWVRRVRGCDLASLAYLVTAGFVEPVPHPGSLPPVADLDTVLATWPFDPLYTLLTHDARERFGLLRGIKFVMAIERCSGVDELRRLGVKFHDHLAATHGAESAAIFRRRLERGPANLPHAVSESAVAPTPLRVVADPARQGVPRAAGSH